MTDAINGRLRDHVTSTKFTLTLGGTHIAALAWVHWHTTHNVPSSQLRERGISDRTPTTGPWRFLVPGFRGLTDRGLVVHTHPKPPPGGYADDVPPREVWAITAAGEAVITLLREAGMWDEYAAVFPVVEPAPAVEAVAEPKAPRRRKAA